MELNNSSIHPHSKLLFVITAVVLVVALSGSGYYFWKSKQLKSTPDALITTAPAPAASQENTTATQIPVTTESVSSTATSTSTSAATTISTDMSQINTDEIKETMSELKSVMSSFAAN